MIHLDPFAGSEINETIINAIKAANNADDHATFTFNGITVEVAGDSDPDLIHRDWVRGIRGYHSDTAGPYPPEKLPGSVIASDEAIQKETDARNAIAAKAAEERDRIKRETLQAEIGGVEISLLDPDTWAKQVEINADPYGGAVIQFADAWARLMQVRMDAGAELEDIAEQCITDADTEGITGFMYGCAVQILAKVWVHGERLNKWHNLKYQLGNEGEKANKTGATINPAILVDP